MRPGISTSASSISLRPKSASDRSATLKSEDAVTEEGLVVVVMLDSPKRGAITRATAMRSRPGSPDDSQKGPTYPAGYPADSEAGASAEARRRAGQSRT